MNRNLNDMSILTCSWINPDNNKWYDESYKLPNMSIFWSILYEFSDKCNMEPKNGQLNCEFFSSPLSESLSMSIFSNLFKLNREISRSRLNPELKSKHKLLQCNYFETLRNYHSCYINWSYGRTKFNDPEKYSIIYIHVIDNKPNGPKNTCIDVDFQNGFIPKLIAKFVTDELPNEVQNITFVKTIISSNGYLYSGFRIKIFVKNTSIDFSYYVDLLESIEKSCKSINIINKISWSKTCKRYDTLDRFYHSS